MNPIEAYKGATKTLHCTRLDENGTPVSLSGVTISARLYRYKDPDTTVADLTIVKQEVGAVDVGEFTITLTAADSVLMSRGSYLCQIKYLYGTNTTDLLDPFEWRIL